MPYNFDILVPNPSTYGVLEHFSDKICESMTRFGHKCRLIHGYDGLTKALQDEIPDFTFSFNAPPKDHGIYWCDILQVPHVAILVDTPFHFPGLQNSQYVIPTYDDEYIANTFPNKRFHQKFFVPHAVEQELDSDPSLPKLYDVTLLASFSDFEERQKRWEETYPKDIYDAMMKAIDLTLHEEDLSFIKAFEIAYNESIKENRDVRVLAINLVEILIELESYLKGYEKICQVQAVHDAEVHIFGASNEIESWQRYFDNQSNVIIHDPVSFESAIRIMQQSKIVLNSNLRNKNGTHERVLYGLAAGALVATSVNPYLREYFTDGENILFWNFADLENLNDKIVELLQNPRKLQNMAQKGRDVVMRHFTWDRRMEDLLSALEPVFEQFKQEA